MEADTRVLRQLIDTDSYVVDERSVADAIIARGWPQSAILWPPSGPREPAIDSFQRDA